MVLEEPLWGLYQKLKMKQGYMCYLVIKSLQVKVF